MKLKQEEVRSWEADLIPYLAEEVWDGTTPTQVAPC